MKRLILVLLLGVFVLSLTHSPATAEEKKIPLTATASSTYDAYYKAANAVDGDYNTYWVGASKAAPWWIMFDAGDIKTIGRVNIIWYYNYYTPHSYDIQISEDGQTWEDLYTEIKGVFTSKGEDKEINRSTRYIRLYIHSATTFPVLRELGAYVKLNLPHTIRFQGALNLKEDNTPIDSDEPVSLTFRLYDKETDGDPLWEERQTRTIENGLLDVELGSESAFNLLFDTQYWLEVEVENEVMSPRFKLTNVPYAFTSDR